MKKSILLFSFLFLLISCKTTFNLQNEKNADEQIIECLQSKKIVFIGENHSTVFPILYITQNMENFYNAGLRYLFLEEEGDGFGKDSDFKILSDKYLRYELSEEYLSNYDFFCATNKRIYGIITPYITTNYNLQALYNFIAGFDVKKQTPYRARELSYFALAISYLKYSFGEYFPFSFEENNLTEALAFLNKSVFQSGKAPSSFCKKLPSYWLAYFTNEKADYSRKKSDYEKAIAEWESFLNHEAAFASPGLLTAYDRLSINYSKIGNEEKSHYYKNKKDFLEKVFPWHDIEMYFFGYYNQ